MLNRLFVLGLAAAVFSLAAPCQALIDPTADVLYHPSSQGTAEAALTSQIQATAVTVSGAHAGDDPPPTPNDYYADSHTAVFADLEAGATSLNSGIITLAQFNPNRFLNDDGVTPLGELQGVLLYFTVHLKSGRQVFDNESTEKVVAAIVQIGTSLHAWSYDPDIGINFTTAPNVSVTGDLLADTNGADNFTYEETMTQAQIDAASTGPDKLAAIIKPDNPANFYGEQPIYTDVTDPVALAAFIGTGQVRFDYDSSPITSHYAGNQNVADWAIPPKFDIEARVVYLYAAVPDPASMGLLAAAFAPVLLRRLRKRKSRLS
jgi:hypothetical protein